MKVNKFNLEYQEYGLPKEQKTDVTIRLNLFRKTFSMSNQNGVFGYDDLEFDAHHMLLKTKSSDKISEVYFRPNVFQCLEILGYYFIKYFFKIIMVIFKFVDFLFGLLK
jgi:hypothetical protein